MQFGDDTLFTLQEKQEWTDAYAMFFILMQGLRGTEEPTNEFKDYPINCQAFKINWHPVCTNRCRTRLVVILESKAPITSEQGHFLILEGICLTSKASWDCF